MIVISDTSPIINLAAIGELELLPRLYGSIIVPNAVFEEITITGAGLPGDAEIRNANWVEVRSPKNTQFVLSLSVELDKGEAEAIALAIETNCDWLIIDEKIGRQKAKAYNLKIVGILGILLEAKNKLLIADVSKLMTDLRNKAGFWISEKLYQEVKRLAKE